MCDISIIHTVVHAGIGILANEKELKQIHVSSMFEKRAGLVHNCVEQNLEASSKQDIYFSCQNTCYKSKGQKSPTRYEDKSFSPFFFLRGKFLNLHFRKCLQMGVPIISVIH
ncbi:unnamed protein product [Rangifer tarandus platyrhynchus]|uniref:Uncharacterized protein n=2 Tax=Rangifer tarandus platyrhynchus TaxID=3082113 RepID=A0ABN8YAK4_RANTA|nr:unnamed protein product [Rangifer tarandus platyrhynchus]